MYTSPPVLVGASLRSQNRLAGLHNGGLLLTKTLEKWILSLAPGETVEFTLKPGAGAISRQHIIAVLAVWGDNPRPRDRAMDIVCVWLYN